MARKQPNNMSQRTPSGGAEPSRLRTPLNFDELTDEMERVSSERDVQRLVECLRHWKQDTSNVSELDSLTEHYLGNTWLSTDGVHSAIYSLWTCFRAQAIAGIGGMTMNERLWFFGLLQEFENADKDRKDDIYAKLQAKA